jgi:iron complex outermembrane receptor protein
MVANNSMLSELQQGCRGNQMKNIIISKNMQTAFRAITGAAAAIGAAFVAFTLPSTAMAQQGAAGALLEEIVTVARKRSEAEAVQQVPVAVSAFGAEQLDALFVTKLDDLSHMMPNVQLEAVGTFPGVQNFSIRGQGINSSIPSVDPTVGVFVDGIYIGTTFGVVLDTFDLESIEVLRGPQGLLFGRNVTGGAVLLRTRRPSDEFGVRVRVGGTDESEYNVAASIEGSLIDGTLAGKLVAYYNDDGGYFTNTNPAQPVPAPWPFPGPTGQTATYFNAATGRDVGEMETTFVRPILTWTPTDRQEWTLILESGTTEGDGAVWASVTEQRAGVLPEFTTTQDETGFTDIEWTSGTLELNIDDVGPGTLTNLLGFRETESRSAVDIDGTWLPIFAATGDTENDQFSNELRWSGNFSENWEATLGLYYFEQDITYNEGRYVRPTFLPPDPFVEVTLALGGKMDAENFGIFWNNDIYIGEGFTAQIGVRYTDESKTANIFTAGCFDVVTFNCPTVDLEGDWDNVTPKLGFMQELSDNARLYGFWSKGFRSGGFNFRNARPNVIPPGPTEEEESNTFELGIKSELADGRVRLNVAAFHNDISDIQRELNLPDQFVVVLQGTINAGDVVIKGIETDLVALLTDNFSINLAVGLQDGRYTDVNPDFASFLGEELPRLAPSNAAFGFSWDIPMGAGLINLSGQYTTRENNYYNDSNTERFDTQERVNAAINWFSGNDLWRVSLYGKNLTDEQNWGNLTSIAGLFTAGPMQRGRIIGLEVNWQNR